MNLEHAHICPFFGESVERRRRKIEDKSYTDRNQETAALFDRPRDRPINATRSNRPTNLTGSKDYSWYSNRYTDQFGSMGSM